MHRLNLKEKNLGKGEILRASLKRGVFFVSLICSIVLGSLNQVALAGPTRKDALKDIIMPGVSSSRTGISKAGTGIGGLMKTSGARQSSIFLPITPKRTSFSTFSNNSYHNSFVNNKLGSLMSTMQSLKPGVVNPNFAINSKYDLFKLNSKMRNKGGSVLSRANFNRGGFISVGIDPRLPRNDDADIFKTLRRQKR